MRDRRGQQFRGVAAAEESRKSASDRCAAGCRCCGHGGSLEKILGSLQVRYSNLRSYRRRFGVPDLRACCPMTSRSLADRAGAADGDVELAHQRHRHRDHREAERAARDDQRDQRIGRFAGARLADQDVRDRVKHRDRATARWRGSSAADGRSALSTHHEPADARDDEAGEAEPLILESAVDANQVDADHRADGKKKDGAERVDGGEPAVVGCAGRRECRA